MKKLIALLLIAVLALTCFVACGKKDGDKAANIEGKYVISKMGGEDAPDEYKEAMFVELKADGAATMTMGDEGGDCTWKQDGDKVILTAEGETMEFTLNGNDLTMVENGEEMVFTKQ